MKQLKWYFKNGTKYNTYLVLYEDDSFILVKNNDHDDEKYPEYDAYSFGVKKDFGSFLGFPVNQSCLKKDEAIERLDAFIKIDERYIPTLGEIAETNIRRWQDMINVLKKEIA